MPSFAQSPSRYFRYELMLALGIADERQILSLPRRQIAYWEAFAHVRMDRKRQLAEDNKTMISWWD